MTADPNIGDGRGAEDEMTLGEMLGALRARWPWLLLGPLVAALAAIAITGWMKPVFTAATTLLPPQQSQGGALSALASLGSLSALAGAAAGGGNSADRYVALMRSVTVSDRIIDQFKLIEVYDAKFRVDARRELSTNVQISVGKKDGLITIEVDDTSPQRAADIANRYVDELRLLTGSLAVTEAQQRRLFFERMLKQSRDSLAQAQQALQGSGFNAGALKAEPKAAADAYARLKAEATTAEVRLQTLRGSLADSAPEVRQQLATLAALRDQLARVEQATASGGGPDYIGKYREYKYQETLFELYARQFEIARVDESREGALIQIVDTAAPPERKSRPKRALIVAGTAVATLLLLSLLIVARQAMRGSRP